MIEVIKDNKLLSAVVLAIILSSLAAIPSIGVNHEKRIDTLEKNEAAHVVGMKKDSERLERIENKLDRFVERVLGAE